jgi:hypothetical protein
MTFYFVRAKPKDNISDLLYDLDYGMIHTLVPFGKSLHKSLNQARWDNETNNAIWVEEDYCNPPLAMEREAVLDKYFDMIEVEPVLSEEEGWNTLADKPSFWKVFGLKK